MKISLQDTKVSELRKMVSALKISKIQSTERGEVEVSRGRKAELIAALESHQEDEAQEIEAQEIKAEELNLEMFKLTEEEKLVVDEALEISKMNLLELAKAGLLLKARKLVTELKKVQELTPDQLRNSTLIGSAQAKLRATTDDIVRWNHAQYSNDLRVYLNASILRNLTGSNLNTVKDFLSIYRTPDDFLHTADEHNQHYGLCENDNRKGRDEFGNKIKISELIKQSIPPEKLPIGVEEAPTPEVFSQDVELSVQENFAQRIDKLESEPEIKAECESLMQALVTENGSKSFSSFKKMVTPYRSEIQKLRLRSHNTYTHEYENPRSPESFKDGIAKGSQFTEEGKVLSEPRHLALKFLSPDLYKSQFSK